MTHRTLALVGATGGAGVTRLTLEVGATLARDGRDAVVVDAAYATQGLADHCLGVVDPDVTALTLESGSLEAGTYEAPASANLPGRLALCPARAPFARVARAKAPEAARRLESLAATLADRFDPVLFDTPPVAANQAVAAVTAADRVVLVTPASRRGADAQVRMADRLADLDAPADLEVANRVRDANRVERADVAVPESDVVEGAVPTCGRAEDGFAPAVASVTEVAFDTELDLEFVDGGRIGRFLSRER